MFKKKYSNSLNGISPDGYISQKVLAKIEAETQKKNKALKPVFKRAIVVALSLVIALTVALGITNRNLFTEIFKTKTPEVIEETVYIYKEIDEEQDELVISEPKKPVSSENKELVNSENKKPAESKPENKFDNYGNIYSVISNLKNNSAYASFSLQAANPTDFTVTNNQVNGVDEGDIFKTDGKNIYVLSPTHNILRIIDAENLKVLSEINIKADSKKILSEMYLYKNRVVIMYQNNNFTTADIYDVSNPEKPISLSKLKQEGIYNTSRLINNKLYLITNYSVDTEKIDKNDFSTFVPDISCNNFGGWIPEENIEIFEKPYSSYYTVVCSFDISSGNLLSSKSVLGLRTTIYCSTENIVITGYNSVTDSTYIVRYAINNGNIELKKNGSIEGKLLNQFSIDEHNGYFRFITTVGVSKSNSLTVLNAELIKVGEIKDLAPTEKVYSVRFMGDYAYFVTFRQTDPLFSVDLKNPKNPKVLSALKIPGFSNYLFPFGNGLLLGIGKDADETTGTAGNIKLSMFNISNPADVTEATKLVTDYYSSPSTQSHKTTLIDVNRNLIGIAARNSKTNEYAVYKYENGSFKNLFTVDLESSSNISEYSRGIIIGNKLYIYTERFIAAYDINTFSELDRLRF